MTSSEIALWITASPTIASAVIGVICIIALVIFKVCGFIGKRMKKS